jgi:formate-dependent nitrite reductase cytochrome c552 subunit
VTRGTVAAGALAFAALTTSIPVTAQTPEIEAIAAFRDDVHARAGLNCQSCHGPVQHAGGAAVVYAPVARTRIAAMCATCHADAAYMRKFAPQVRVDQYAQYQTSVHGQRMAAGEDRVATCSDCHHAHGILPVADARSPVAPTNVEKTCARCHADAARMTPFKRSRRMVEERSRRGPAPAR